MSDLQLPIEGFGATSMEELIELRKALDISGANSAAVTGFDSLRMESLEATLKVLTFRMNNIALWQAIRKDQAFSTVEEYNRLETYGAFESGVFTASGELPAEQDSVYSRQSQQVKFAGTTRIVNHPATLIRTVPADLVANETSNGAVFLLGKINSALYFGDADMVPQEFNGLTRQIVGPTPATPLGHVLDVRGGGLTQDIIEDGVQLVVDNFGSAVDLFGNPKVFSDFSKTFHNFQRFASPNVGAGFVGTPVNGFDSQSGRVAFHPDTFARRGQLLPAAASGVGAPGAPTMTAATDAGPIAGSQFVAADVGDFEYHCTAVNRFGESGPSAAISAVTVAAGDSVTLSLIDGTGTVTAFRVYRSGVDGTTHRFMVRVAHDGASPTPYVDLNADIPGTFTALLLDTDMQSLNYRQLSPMIRMPLATIAPSIRWMQLIYGTPIVYQPLRNVVIKNIAIQT